MKNSRICFLLILFCITLLNGCGSNKNNNSGESVKETYPFQVELIYPQDYVKNSSKVLLQLKLTPDSKGDKAKIGFECYDGVKLSTPNLIEISEFVTNQEKTIDIEADLSGTDRGKFQSYIDIFDKEKNKLYQMKRELFLISTEDGILCSSADDYAGLTLKHINKLKSEGRISDAEYKKRKAELMRGDAKIETTVESVNADSNIIVDSNTPKNSDNNNKLSDNNNSTKSPVVTPKLTCTSELAKKTASIGKLTIPSPDNNPKPCNTSIMDPKSGDTNDSPVNNDNNSVESIKEKYPFRVELICPQDYVKNGTKIQLQLKLIPDSKGDSAKIGFECFDGVKLSIANSAEINQLVANQEKTIDFEADLTDADRGTIQCSISIFNKEKNKINQMKKELFLISTEDGIICSSTDDYGGLAIKHLNKLKSEGRISGAEYEKRKKEIMRGGTI